MRLPTALLGITAPTGLSDGDPPRPPRLLLSSASDTNLTAHSPAVHPCPNASASAPTHPLPAVTRRRAAKAHSLPMRRRAARLPRIAAASQGSGKSPSSSVHPSLTPESYRSMPPRAPRPIISRRRPLPSSEPSILHNAAYAPRISLRPRARPRARRPPSVRLRSRRTLAGAMTPRPVPRRPDCLFASAFLQAFQNPASI
ncbi:hypothetical protein OH77DRAFT_1016668 [Trametes cingulata]|nr:hypothetical protein OH77DRAFT_1016668 [Trametes cingulata]